MTKCISANPQRSGYIVTKVGLNVQTRAPKIQEQGDSAQFETKCDNRFDDPSYYYGTVTP